MQTDAPFWDSLVFSGIDDVDVEAATAAFGAVEVVARGRVAGAKCPECGRFSDRVHDRYHRRLKVLPLAERGFVIRLAVRRSICGAANCPRRTFAERQIVDGYAPLKVTLRQVTDRLVSGGVLAHTPPMYRRLSAQLAQARREGGIRDELDDEGSPSRHEGADRYDALELLGHGSDRRP
ncbi:transposase family protein [Streptomyces goshikiensis]|uniref:transposase family protein n=1 Tax=Streptomyces goshikiensis TaxID=1942 RepID=UPI0036C9143D